MKRILFLFLVFGLSLNLYAVSDQDRLASLYVRNKTEQAISLCKRKIQDKDSSDREYYLLNLALLYEEKGDISKAIDLLQSYNQEIKSSNIVFHLGRLYCLTSQAQEAVSLLKECTDIGTKSRDVYFYLGLAYEDLGQIDKALTSYKQSLEYDPYFVLPLVRVAEIYFDLKNYKKAVDNFQMIKRFDPSIKLSYRKLAFAFFYENDYLASFKEASRYLNMGKSDKEVKLVLRRSREELGEDFFRKEREKKEKIRKAKLLRVTHFAKGENIPKVKICIGKDLKEFYLKPTQEMFVSSSDNSAYRLDAGKVYKLSLTPGKSLVIAGIEKGSLEKEFYGPVFLKPKTKKGLLGVFGLSQGKGTYWHQQIDHFFRGEFKVFLLNEKLCILNILNIEEYLYGVVPSEVSPQWPESALQAQAVAARTRAVKSLGAHSNQGFDFCNTVHCQVYLGASREDKNTNKAIDDTQGIVLTAEGEPIPIFYSSNCGGHTQGYNKREGVKDYRKGTDLDVPLTPWNLYKTVTTDPDAFCKLEGTLRSRYRWQRIYSLDQLNRDIKERYPSIENVDRIRVLTRDSSGHSDTLQIISGEKAELIQSEFRIRRNLDNLRSSLFRVETKYDKKGNAVYFIFWGGGFGHGMGLCQYGAKGMADKGYPYHEILHHYLPWADLKKLY